MVGERRAAPHLPASLAAAARPAAGAAGVTVLFYRRTAGPEPPRQAFPADAEVEVWRAEDGWPPAGSRRAVNLAWWLFARLGLFACPGFAELTMRSGGRLAHRLVVTPRWYRFPFMGATDLQIGAVWTHPELRGRGLARAAIGEAHRLAPDQLWYVVDSGNGGSIRLIEGCGYRLVGTGRRTRPFGLPMLGRFRLDKTVG
jgi:GNAT superfamily N-acetyltransferase